MMEILEMMSTVQLPTDTSGIAPGNNQRSEVSGFGNVLEKLTKPVQSTEIQQSAVNQTVQNNEAVSTPESETGPAPEQASAAELPSAETSDTNVEPATNSEKRCETTLSVSVDGTDAAPIVAAEMPAEPVKQPVTVMEGEETVSVQTGINQDTTAESAPPQVNEEIKTAELKVQAVAAEGKIKEVVLTSETTPTASIAAAAPESSESDDLELESGAAPKAVPQEAVKETIAMNTKDSPPVKPNPVSVPITDTQNTERTVERTMQPAAEKQPVESDNLAIRAGLAGNKVNLNVPVETGTQNTPPKQTVRDERLAADPKPISEVPDNTRETIKVSDKVVSPGDDNSGQLKQNISGLPDENLKVKSSQEIRTAGIEPDFRGKDMEANMNQSADNKTEINSENRRDENIPFPLRNRIVIVQNETGGAAKIAVPLRQSEQNSSVEVKQNTESFEPKLQETLKTGETVAHPVTTNVSREEVQVSRTDVSRNEQPIQNQSVNSQTQSQTSDSNSSNKQNNWSHQPPVQDTKILMNQESTGTALTSDLKNESARLFGNRFANELSGMEKLSQTRILDKIQQTIMVVSANRIAKAEVSVDGGKMGQMKIRYEETDQANHKVTIVVENESVKAQIQRHLPQLLDSLQHKGADISSLQAEVKDQTRFTEQDAFRQYGNQSRNGSRQNQGLSIPTELVAEQAAVRNYGYNTIEVTA